MSKKILIIEDDVAIVESLRALLESRGFEVCVTDDGDTAVETVRAESPDLVILDLYLPGRDGIEVYKNIAAPTDATPVPVIVLSALTKQQIKMIVSKVSNLMSDAVVFSKPVSPEALISRIEEMISVKK